MQEALEKFRAKCEFLERAYAQIIAMDAQSFEGYNKENQDIIELALKVEGRKSYQDCENNSSSQRPERESGRSTP